MGVTVEEVIEGLKEVRAFGILCHMKILDCRTWIEELCAGS